MKKICLAILLPVLLVLCSFTCVLCEDTAPAVTGSHTLPVEPPGDRRVTPGVGIPEQRNRCPEGAYINCMPPVSEKNRPYCSREYLQWAKEHCPGVKVVY